MVTMCSLRSWLILSSIAASVVVLPEPVGPVTSTRPRGFSHSFSTTAGRPSSRKPRISWGISRNAAASAPRWWNTLQRKRARLLMPNEKSISRFSSSLCFWLSVRIE